LKKIVALRVHLTPAAYATTLCT